MNYRYKKTQIFRKKLDVPKDIINKVYDCTLYFTDFIEYGLDDKIPISCICNQDRIIVEKFGIDKCRTLDWELINKTIYYVNDMDFRDILMTIDSQVSDINMALYELVKDQIRPRDYSSKMKEVYSDRLMDIPQIDDTALKDTIYRFNDGRAGLKEIIYYWDLFKNKDLSYCLLHDADNKKHITDSILKAFMDKYSDLAILIVEHNDIYTFISTLSYLTSEEEKNNYIRQFTNYILSNTHVKEGYYRPEIELTDEEYKAVFKYSSLESELDKIGGYNVRYVIEELKSLPKDYVFNIPIPFSVLLNSDVLIFIGEYGLKNVVDFDNECGHFFTKNNCEMLKLMHDMYLHYGGNIHDPSKTIYTKNNVDENGNYIDRPYTKDEFYEAMKRMIIYGPTNWDYADKAPDYRDMTGEFRVRNAELFISEQAPEELQKLFYTKSITPQLLLQHPEYIPYLNGTDLSSCFKNREIKVEGSNALYEYENIYKFLSSKNDFNGVIDFIIEYSDVLDCLFDRRMSYYYQYEIKFSVDDSINQMKKRINETFIKLFVEKGLAFPKVIPQSMKDRYPLYFLPDDAPPEIKEKFYNREFNISDFTDDPKLFNMFEKTNIACGFPLDMAWIIPLFENADSIEMANYYRIKVISAYSKIQDFELQKAFKEYVMEFGTNIDVEKIEYVSEILSRLALSNSNEIFTFRKELATQLLKSDNPLESLSKIEDVFIKNNIPTVGKIYSCFEILHPDFQGFNFESSMISPVLKKTSTTGKKIITFSDLIKASFGSNNRSVNAYLKNIEFGSNLYEIIKSGQLQFNLLGQEEQNELLIFCDHLATLYNHTMKAKKEKNFFTSTGNIIEDILLLAKLLSPDGTLDYNLGDRVIRMFCGFTGINTLNQAKEYINMKIQMADARNRDAANTDMVLEQGDFIKGIGDIKYLRNILQNGSVSKEYLGSSAGSDLTPLDTDVSMIMSSDGTISEKMGATAAAGYGPIWFVLKNDDRFITTRTKDGDLSDKRDMSKIEAFYTGAIGKDHYGIRTGFASSEINYIVMEKYDPRVGLEIAMNGFYIPVANKEGKIVFTPQDYDDLRQKMSGLAYYGLPEYEISDNLDAPGISDTKERMLADIEKTNRYNQEIKNVIKNAIIESGISKVVDGFSSDLSFGMCELYSTGSTARNTNVPNDSDFDYLVKVDRDIYFHPEKLDELKRSMKQKLGFTEGFGGKICGTIQKEDGTKLEIEISFCPRTDKVEFSTDVSLSSKLDAIREQYPDSYEDVLANIVFAKEFFKSESINAYKSLKSDSTQGGLGGIGIENWILQHGGSFVDAAMDFVEKAERAGSFANFKAIYQVYDFGDNHYSDKSNVYPHDNFVGDDYKMGEAAFNRIVNGLKEYLKIVKTEQKSVNL